MILELVDVFHVDPEVKSIQILVKNCVNFVFLAFSLLMIQNANYVHPINTLTSLVLSPAHHVGVDWRPIMQTLPVNSALLDISLMTKELVKNVLEIVSPTQRELVSVQNADLDLLLVLQTLYVLLVLLVASLMELKHASLVL